VSDHSSTRARDEQHFSLLDIAAMDERVPGGEESDGESSSLGHGELRRLANEQRLRHDHLGCDGVAARHPRDHGVAHAETAHTRPDLAHQAGGLGPNGERQLRPVLVAALQHQQIKIVERRRVHLHAHLAVLERD